MDQFDDIIAVLRVFHLVYPYACVMEVWREFVEGS